MANTFCNVTKITKLRGKVYLRVHHDHDPSGGPQGPANFMTPLHMLMRFELDEC